MPATTTPATIARLLEHEEGLRTNAVSYCVADIEALSLEPYWQQVLLLFEVYRRIVHEDVDRVDPQLLGQLWPGLRWLLGHKWPACASAASIR